MEICVVVGEVVEDVMVRVCFLDLVVGRKKAAVAE